MYAIKNFGRFPDYWASSGPKGSTSPVSGWQPEGLACTYQNPTACQGDSFHGGSGQGARASGSGRGVRRRPPCRQVAYADLWPGRAIPASEGPSNSDSARATFMGCHQETLVTTAVLHASPD